MLPVMVRGGLWLPWRLVDGGLRVRCRMYHNFRGVYEGFSKNLLAAFGYNVLLFVFVWLWLGMVFWEPLIVLALWGMGVSMPAFSPLLAATAVALSLLLWGISHWRFGFPIYVAFLYPASVLLVGVITGRSVWLTLRGCGTWKGRALGKPRILSRWQN